MARSGLHGGKLCGVRPTHHITINRFPLASLATWASQSASPLDSLGTCNKTSLTTNLCAIACIFLRLTNNSGLEGLATLRQKSTANLGSPCTNTCYLVGTWPCTNTRKSTSAQSSAVLLVGSPMPYYSPVSTNNNPVCPHTKYPPDPSCPRALPSK